MKVETKRRAPQKSTPGSEKNPTYMIHRRRVTMPMMQASNDTCRSCKETLILTVEDSGKVSLECNHTRVRTVNRINIWLMKVISKAIRTQALEDQVRTFVTVEWKTKFVEQSRMRGTNSTRVKEKLKRP